MIVLKITYLGNDHDLTWKGGGGGVMGFFLKKYSYSQCCGKKYSDFCEGKKNLHSEFLSYNLMLVSEKKFRALRDKKNKYSNSWLQSCDVVLSEKKILNETKNIIPRPPAS